MASLATELASAAELQSRESGSSENRQSKSEQQSDNFSRRQTLRRNTHFSRGSHLVVLRDDEGSCDLANPRQTSRENTKVGQECVPKNHVQQQSRTTEPDSLQRRPRHMAFHDGIQRELEARSILYARQDSNHTPSPVRIDNDPNPPSFFIENFPLSLKSRHEVLEHRERDYLPSTSSMNGEEGFLASDHTNDSVSGSLSSQSSGPTSLRQEIIGSNALSPAASLRSLAPGPPSLDFVDPIHVSTLQSFSGSECFAKDVRIRGWQRVGSYARGWVAYDVLIEARSVSFVLIQGITLQSYKRYTSFLDLARRLRMEAPHYAKELPSLPPRHGRIWHKYLPSFLEGRRRALQQWLHYTIRDPRWGTTRAYREWVLER